MASRRWVSLREWFTEHWGLKLMSLLLAVGFWSYAHGEEITEISRQIPLQIETSAEQFGISKRSTASLHVRLKAPRSVIPTLSTADLTAHHEIRGIEKSGEYSFRMTPEDIKLPSKNVHITSIFPEIVSVVIDETIVKKIPVVPDFLDEPAYGYKVLKEKVVLDPNAILVEGPKAVLDQMRSVKTDPIELVGRTRSFRKIARVHLGQDLRPTSESIIDVFVPIREELSESAFADVSVQPLGLPTNGYYAVIETDKISFSLKGPKSELDRLQLNGVFVYVNIKGLKKGNYKIPATFILPEAVSLKGEAPIVELVIERVS